MKTRYELLDRSGRYVKGEFDDDENLLQITMFLYLKSDVPVESALEEAGYTITSKTEVHKPQIVPLRKEIKDE